MCWCALVKSIYFVYVQLIFKFFVLELKFRSVQVTDPNGQLSDLVLCVQDGLVGDGVLQVCVHGCECSE